MTAPDPAYVRMYRSTVDRHRKAALDDAEWIAQNVASLITGLETHGRDLGEARRIAVAAVNLAERIAALDALRDVSFFTTDPDAGEQP